MDRLRKYSIIMRARPSRLEQVVVTTLTDWAKLSVIIIIIISVIAKS